METNTMIWLTAAVTVMLLVPGILIQTVGSDAVLAVCMVLLLAVNPLCAVLTGAFSGRKLRKRWMLPLVLALLFALGYGAFFEMPFSAMTLYAVVYVAVGGIAMAVAAVFKG